MSREQTDERRLPKKSQKVDLQAQAEQRLNQLVAEVRVLEAYYQEIELRRQSASAALLDTRAANEALSVLSSSAENELLVPIGGGLLLPATAPHAKRFIVNIGAGVAIEKTTDSAKIFLQSRESELEKAVGALEQQRREVGSRLQTGRSAIEQITQQIESQGRKLSVL